MRRLLSYLTVLVVLSIVGYTLILNNTNEGWSDYIQNHPYSQNVSLAEINEMPKKDRPDLAAQQNFLMTVDPKIKSVPVDRLLSAFEAQKQRKSSMFADGISDVVWEERGPNNVGGRTRALMWDPNDANDQKLWAAGVAGGIWFNNDITDANTSWQNVNDFMANLAITTLAYDPTNTQVFYAGTGEGYFNGGSVRGAGIFKSTDAGATWAQINSTINSSFNYVQRVVVTSNGTILASTRDAGIQRSTDGGDTWNTVLNISSAGAGTSRGNDIEVASNGDIYASLGIFSTGSIHRSTDDGATWTAVTPSGGSPERIELAVAPSASSETGTTVIYAVSSFDVNIEWFKKSEDGGDTWTDITIPKYRSQNCTESSSDFTRGQAWYDLTLAVSPTDADVLLAGGINVSKTSDGGTTMAEISYWTGGCDTYVHADIHNILFRPNNPNEAVIGSDGGVSYSTDAGSSSDPTFANRNKDYNVTQFYAVAAQNTADEVYFIGGTQDNGTHQFTAANGLSTVEINGGDGAFCFIDQDDNNYQISSYVYNVYDLHNATGAYQGNLSNDQDRGRFINPADYDNTADILYSAGNGNELMRISGITGTPSSQEALSVSIDGGTISAIRADANTANRLFVGTGSGNIYRIENANATPSATNITSGITTNGYISSIDIGISDDELIVTFSNYGVISVWYTDDGGTTWVDKDNDASLPDIPVRWALFNPKNTAEVLLATELGVWSTTNIKSSTPGWEQTSNSLANVRCDMLQHRASDDLVLVATHGRGIFTAKPFDGLAAPSGFEVAQDFEFITLNWTDNSSEEDNYVVERSIGDESSFEVIATLDPNTETYSDAIPVTNEQVYYRVYATSTLKGNSQVLSDDLLSLPAAPTLDAASDETFSSFTVNWTSDDGATIFFIDVSESEDFSSFVTGYESKLVSGSNTSVTGLASGTYYFRIAASNSSGLSDFSTVESITLNPLSVLDNEVVYYPNPNRGYFTLKGSNEDMSFQIINVLGKSVDFEVIRKEDGVDFDISNLSTGSYFLRINDGNKVVSKPIIKQ